MGCGTRCKKSLLMTGHSPSALSVNARLAASGQPSYLHESEYSQVVTNVITGGDTKVTEGKTTSGRTILSG